MKAAQLLALLVQQPMATKSFQGIEHQGGRRQRARTSFGVQRQARHLVVLHLPAHLPLQQCLQQLDYIIQPQQAGHPAAVLQPHRCHAEDTLGLLVPLLHERLILVLAQGLRQAPLLVVRKQREEAVAACLPPKRLGVLLEADAIAARLDAAVLRVGPRPPRPYLPIVLFHFPINDDPQQALDLLVGQDAFGGLTCLARRAELPPPPGRLQSVQTGVGPLQTLLPALPVLLLLLRAAIPEQAVALGAAPRALHAVVDHVRPAPTARVGLAMYLTPLQGVCLQVVAEPTVLRTRTRHDAEEASLLAGDVSHVLACAEFAVGHVQEVAVTNDLPQERPGVLVDLVVGGVAVVDLTM